jgi:hypothetical protein
MRLNLYLTAVASLVLSANLFAGPIVLSNNLAEPLESVDTLSTTYWHAISFTTDGNTYTLDTVTLLMELGAGATTSAALPNAVADVPEVDLYSDNSGSPGSLITALTATSAYDYTLQDVTFGGAGVTLSANSTYWVVLRALSGAVSWGYAATNNGTGIGFTDVLASSNDSGSTWHVALGDLPDQAEVTADPAGVPEPSTVFLTGIGFLALAGAARRRFV